MDAEMTDVKNHHVVEQDVAGEGEDHKHHQHHQHHHQHRHHHHHDEQHDEHMDDSEANAAGGADQQHYDQHYDESYAQQYEEGGVGEEQAEGVGEALYEGQEAEYEQGADGVSFDVAVDAAAAVASAAAAAAHVGQEYEGEEGEGEPQEYAEQQEYAGHDGYMDESQHHHQQYAEQVEDDQTLAAHPASTRDLESMVVDAEGGVISSEVSQAMNRYDYAPDGLQTLAATSSAITPHDTPTRYNMHGKPMMPKFNRARNWSTEETKILLAELERIAASHPDDRRETVLRSHSTFEEIAEILRDKGYSNRDGQGCMIRWRNLLRVYKQLRAQSNDGHPPSGHPNMQYAGSIENIYRFPPDSMHYMHSEGSPGMEGSPVTGMARSWSAANGSGGLGGGGGIGSASYETPARKRTREITMVTEHIDSVDQKLEQTMEYLSQQNDILRSLEERLTRTEEALKASETALEILNVTIGEKDAKREELQNQLMVTVQALSQVIAVKKAEDQQQQQA
ncbi:hypothetical protein GGI21_002371 [Coemansia aciculifera]|uniref:Uncharacterized protein n=1 Tax=Coemansia aciculifera TaxID=417176 RepID=A0ACC1M1Q0_9FUNG|nr:hypothetical protein IWW38_003081 [Coemansia aciculifera]KAJ2908952.1 hypothetical protein GGI21_002371 [Coemansia aciculifera]